MDKQFPILNARHKRPDSGFTLAELLVASALISVVLGSVYSMFFTVTTSWRAIEQDYDPHRDARNFFTLFQREFANIEMRTAHLFEGDDSEITMFIVSEPFQVDEGEGRHLLRVSYRYNGRSDEIIREEAFVETALPKPTNGSVELDRGRIKTTHEEEFVVATHVTDMNIRYLWYPVPNKPDPKMPPPRITPIYQNEHRNKWGKFPNAIELSIAVADHNNEDASQFFELLIPIQGDRVYFTQERLLGIFKGRR